MKHLLIILLVLGLSELLWSQGIWGAETGKSFSTFKFDDGQGTYSSEYRHIAGDRMGFSYGKSLGEVGMWKLELGYREGGSRLYMGLDLVEWRLSYVDVSLRYEVDWEITEGIGVKLGLGPYGARRVMGEQRIGNRVYNLASSEALISVDWGISLQSGLYINVTRGSKIGLVYGYYGGLQNLENQTVNPRQKTFLRSHTIGLGFTVETSKKGSDDNR